MRIPPEKIDEVRLATDIVDYIGSFVRLKKRGKNFVGLCPFHTEKTPSFNVSPERQMYHCFGCGVGGNVVTFVMEYEKVSFVEAIRSLAEKAGIALPQFTPEAEAVASEQEQLYEVCRVAGLFYHRCLTETNEGKLALEYFHHRGFSDETIRLFGLGYAPSSWDALIKHAEEKKFSLELLEKAGLVRKRDDGTYYDYFRGRAVFPIFSTTGRVIGFGARKMLEDDPLGKYINSPETSIYNKSRILYGISHSKETIREHDNAILVEGYADLISVFQAGVKNVVASSGTALTEDQIRLIGRYTKKITIVYDADSAGSSAALRGVDLILENDLDVRVAALPESEDPDSFVRKHGGEAFRKLVEGAISFIDFIAQTYEKQGKLSTPEGQAQTVRAIVQSIAKMKDELKRNFYIKHVAEKYKLYESTLYRELEKFLGEQRRLKRERVEVSRPVGIPVFQREIVDIPQSVVTEIPAVERDLIHAMVDGGKDVVQFVFQHVTTDDFTNPHSKTLAAHLLQKVEEGEELDPSSLVDEIEDSVQKRLLAEVIFSRYQLSKGWSESGANIEQADPQKVASDALVVLRRRTLEKMIEENQRLLRNASQSGENVIPFLERHQQLLEGMKELESKAIAHQANPDV
ncbi:MAG: DNA primase [Ignavibacteriae bacterium]|nr:DNA primase [Ignavibacteriota bacterium]